MVWAENKNRENATNDLPQKYHEGGKAPPVFKCVWMFVYACRGDVCTG